MYRSLLCLCLITTAATAAPLRTSTNIYESPAYPFIDSSTSLSSHHGGSHIYHLASGYLSGLARTSKHTFLGGTRPSKTKQKASSTSGLVLPKPTAIFGRLDGRSETNHDDEYVYMSLPFPISIYGISSSNVMVSVNGVSLEVPRMASRIPLTPEDSTLASHRTSMLDPTSTTSLSPSATLQPTQTAAPVCHPRRSHHIGMISTSAQAHSRAFSTKSKARHRTGGLHSSGTPVTRRRHRSNSTSLQLSTSGRKKARYSGIMKLAMRVFCQRSGCRVWRLENLLRLHLLREALKRVWC